MAGLMEFLQRPNVAEGFGALGQILGAQDKGQVANISPFIQQMDQNKQNAQWKEQLGGSDLAQHFSPQEMKFLASLPPQAAQGLIAERVFAKPAADKLETFNGPDGVVYQFNPRTGETKPLTGAKQEAPDSPSSVREYEFYTQQEQGEGRQPLSYNDWQIQKQRASAASNVGSIPAGQRLVTDPVTGAQHLEYIPGSSEERKANEGAAKTQAEDIKKAETAEGMMSVIDGVLNDPALDNATGLWAWTQAVPGTSAYRFGTRVRQLQGQAFLQAFESLKGSGQITEIEGQKATDAIGRLDSAQHSVDYREALAELRGILETAAGRARGADPALAGPPTGAPVRVTTKEQLDALPSGTVFIAPDGSTRRKN